MWAPTSTFLSVKAQFEKSYFWKGCFSLYLRKEAGSEDIGSLLVLDGSGSFQPSFSSSQITRSFAKTASRYFRKDIESLSVGWVPPFICAAKLSPQSKPSHSPTLPTLTSTPSSSLGTWENLIIRSFLPISSSSSHWQLLNQVCRGQLILCRGSVYDTTRPKM